jgi:anti-sigma28 factor (negative regulator of flagellin synthesis)
MAESKQGEQNSPPRSESVEPVDSQYSPEYLREVASGDARQKRLDELKRRIELGAYRIDPDWVAEELLQRGALDSD